MMACEGTFYAKQYKLFFDVVQFIQQEYSKNSFGGNLSALIILKIRNKLD